MKFLRFSFFFSVIFMISAGLVFAQEQKPAEQPPVDKKAESPAMTLGALMYMNWHIGLTDTSDKTVSSSDKARYNKKNTFDFERLYLDLKYQMDEVWSARITTDIANNIMIEDVKDADQEITDSNGDTAEVTSKTGTNSTKYRLYVRHAFVQAKKKIDPVEIQVKAGMVDTPVAAYIEGIGDQRWLVESMFGLSSKMMKVNGKSYSLDTTADMGVQLQANYEKLITLVGSVTNGEGFKNTYEYDAGTRNEGKAYTGRLGITPIEGLTINGFYRMEGTNTEESKYKKGYYGAGVVWVSDILRAGINYLLPYEKVDGEKLANLEGNEYDMSVVDAWLSVYLDKMINMPLIVMARYGIADTGFDDGKTTFTGCGLGYVFNKYCRVMAWYSQIDNEAIDAADGPNSEKTFAVKAEVRI